VVGREGCRVARRRIVLLCGSGERELVERIGGKDAERWVGENYLWEECEFYKGTWFYSCEIL
jgi:hypothetical protein